MATKKKAVQLATEIFDKGYATGTWYKKFSKATAAETKPKKARKKAVKKVEKATLEGRPGVPKPKKRTRSSILYWSDIETYVKKKYDKDFRDWAGKYSKNGENEEAEYQDFWHFICDKCDVSNDTTIWLFPGDWMEEDDCPPWRKEVCEILVKEFGPDFEAFVSW